MSETQPEATKPTPEHTVMGIFRMTDMLIDEQILSDAPIRVRHRGAWIQAQFHARNDVLTIRITHAGEACVAVVKLLMSMAPRYARARGWKTISWVLHREVLGRGIDAELRKELKRLDASMEPEAPRSSRLVLSQPVRSGTELMRTRCEKAIAVVDLPSGWYSSFRGRDASLRAGFLEEYREACVDATRAKGGRIVRFVDNACLVVFPPDHVAEALACVLEVRRRIQETAEGCSVPVGLGAGLHIGTVTEGEFGKGNKVRYDVVGTGVQDAFDLSRGVGVRITEAARQALPARERSRWRATPDGASWSLVEEGQAAEPS